MQCNECGHFFLAKVGDVRRDDRYTPPRYIIDGDTHCPECFSHDLNLKHGCISCSEHEAMDGFDECAACHAKFLFENPDEYEEWQRMESPPDRLTKDERAVRREYAALVTLAQPAELLEG